MHELYLNNNPYHYRLFYPFQHNKQGTIEESGFGNNGETYQNIIISSSAYDTPSIYTNIHDYYYMKLFNNHSYEELFFYSYLDDIVTKSKLNFIIRKGDWDLFLFSSGNNTYKGDRYIKNDVIIDTKNEPITPTVIDGIHDTIEIDNDLFFNEYNYTNITGENINIDIANKKLNLRTGISSFILY